MSSAAICSSAQTGISSKALAEDAADMQMAQRRGCLTGTLRAGRRRRGGRKLCGVPAHSQQQAKDSTHTHAHGLQSSKQHYIPDADPASLAVEYSVIHTCPIIPHVEPTGCPNPSPNPNLTPGTDSVLESVPELLRIGPHLPLGSGSVSASKQVTVLFFFFFCTTWNI